MAKSAAKTAPAPSVTTEQVAPPDLLGEMLDKLGTKLAEAKVEVPKGWYLLPAGPERKVRVNRRHVQSSLLHPKPWIVVDGKVEILCYEVRLLAVPELKAEQKASGCSVTASLYMGTTGAILIRRK